jgi:hypothetical protein
MYSYRFIAFFVFTGLFWAVELMSAATAWLVVSYYLVSSKASSEIKTEEGPEGKIKTEETDSDTFLTGGDLSDTPRTFPTFSNQPPLRSPSNSSRASRTGEDEIAATTKVEPLFDERSSSGKGGGPEESYDSGVGTSIAGWTSSGSNVQRRSSQGKRSEDS